MKSNHAFSAPSFVSWILIAFLMFVIFFIAPPAVFAASSLTVRSEYYNVQTGKWANPINWIFQRQDEDQVTVFKEGAAGPVVILRYDSAGHLDMVEKHSIQGEFLLERSEDVEGPLVLSDGFPVPYDYLSSPGHLFSEVEFSEKISGLTFKRTLTREVIPFTTGEALAAGMLSPADPPVRNNKDLTLIVIRKSGRLVVQQLWAEGDTFWLYEETPLRRSRRLF